MIEDLTPLKEHKNIYFLDAGHGGIDEDGNYLTAGKRSPLWSDGTQYFEGQGNRDIVEVISKKLEALNVPFVVLCPEVADVPLFERVARVLRYRTKLKKIVISVHSDGWKTETAHGWSVFTSKGQTESDNLADCFIESAKELLPNTYRIRGKKEANFFMLQRHPFTAVLTENLFHTNKKDCKFLMSEEGRETIANIHVNAILKYEQKPKKKQV